jgi:hypothetical protein
MVKVDTYASYNKATAVSGAINTLCGNADTDYPHGYHTRCLSNSPKKGQSMGDYPSFCTLHALQVRKRGAGNQEGVFVCPSGLNDDQILAAADSVE